MLFAQILGGKVNHGVHHVKKIKCGLVVLELLLHILAFLKYFDSDVNIV